MRLSLVATLAALAVALPTGYHRKPSANFEDKLDRDAERMQRVKVGTEVLVKSEIAKAVKLLKDTRDQVDIMTEKNLSAKKRRIKSNIHRAEQMLLRAGGELAGVQVPLGWDEYEGEQTDAVDPLDYGAFAAWDRDNRRAKDEDFRV